MAKEFLSQRGVPYQEVDVSRDRAAAAALVQATGQMGVPVITVDGQHVIGFDQRRLEELLATRRRSGLGLSVADAAARGLGPGAYVGTVRDGGPAARAGVQPGDVIVAVDGQPVTSVAGLSAATAAAGERVQITYLRAGARHTVQAAR